MNGALSICKPLSLCLLFSHLMKGPNAASDTTTAARKDRQVNASTLQSKFGRLSADLKNMPDAMANHPYRSHVHPEVIFHLPK